MMRDLPPLAFEGHDPWEKLQIDPATRRLAEFAASAAGLAVDEWLERAIRRACPSAFRSAYVIPAAPASGRREAAPAPGATSPAEPRQSEASFDVILARLKQRQAYAQQSSEPEAQSQVDAPVEPLPPFLTATAAAAPEPPRLPRRAAALRARLTRQRVQESEEEETRAQLAPPIEQPGAEPGQDQKSDAATPLFGGDDAPNQDAEARRRFNFWREDHPGADALPLWRRGGEQLALLAIGIALAVTAGAVTAQYLIPGASRSAHLGEASSNAITRSLPAIAATPSDAPPLPRLTGGGDTGANSALLGTPNSPPSEPSSLLPIPPLPSTGSAPSGDAAPSSDLPPLPVPSSLPPSRDSAASDVTSLPPAPTVAATPQAAPSVSEDATAAPAAPSPSTANPDLAPSTKPATAPANGNPATPAPQATTTAAPASSKAAATAPAAPGHAATTTPHPLKGDAGDNVPADPKALAPWLEARAGNGDAIAQYRLGVLYALGQGVPQDYQRAAELFKTAAQGGVAEAQYNIGVMYGEGLGIGRDPDQAVQWYEKAAAQGNANAAFNLGVAYSNGVGVAQSMDKAAQWFRRAAVADVLNAQFNLGLLYERGDGVPVSQIEAYAWYSAAAARGDAGAADRRDHLASTLSPASLKEAQARARQVASTIEANDNSAESAASLTRATAPKSTPTPPQP